MKIKFFLLITIVCFAWIFYSGFSNNDDNPKWSQDPSTKISLNPEGDYLELPQGTDQSFSNEPRYISTPQGVFSVGPNFRVHPTSARTQSEVPITRHPLNPYMMFASANTFNVGGSTTFSTSHYVTTNGGISFFGDDTTNFNFGDPGPMVDHTGRLIISYITGTGAMGAAYSTNLGTTWSGTVTFPGSTTSSDKNLSAVDGEVTSAFYGRLYTVYTEFGGAFANRIVSTWSSDGGVTWSNIIPVSPVPSAGHHHQGCDVTVDIFGWVRVVFANCTTNGQNSTEDFLGWAESGTGGISWADVSDVKVNTNGIRSADLLTPSSSIIRANGFPRIDGDRTCGQFDGDEYVVMAEKNFAPALDNADIVLMKTPDGGASWTRVRVNQNGSGSYEYCPAVNVDASGAINVCYYSTRNAPTNDSAQIYLSRSTDGGLTFVDVLVSDHKFKPIPISGTASGYQGDYIGITSGGAGKIIPYWCEQNTTTGGRYQAYAALVDVSIAAPCEDFICTRFAGTTVFPVTTANFYEEFTGTNYWNRLTPSAFNLGSGSARFNGWSATAGTSQSLTSYNFPAAAANTYITFDHAYQPWSGGNVDSLIIETSANGGTSFTILQKLWGGLDAQAGPLNTVFTGGGEFTPTGGQWASRNYLLPVGTNKVRMRARSGFGNDIWLDNVCVQVLAVPQATGQGIASQGMWIDNDPYWRLPNEPVKIYLYRSDFPNVKVDSANGIMGNNAVCNVQPFTHALSGNYYKVIRHRNSIETWTNIGVDYVRGTTGFNHNLVAPIGQAYANNQAQVSVVPSYWGMYSGDLDQDGFIDLSDEIVTYNEASAFVSGYELSDVNGDLVTDLSDLLIVYNNASDFVQVKRPPGALPEPAPTDVSSLNITGNEPDAMKEKIELTRKLMLEQKTVVTQKDVPNWDAKVEDPSKLPNRDRHIIKSNSHPPKNVGN